MQVKSDDLINKEIIPGVIVLIIIAICNALLFSLPREDLVTLTREDGIVEYSAVACYLLSVIILIFLSFKARALNRADSTGSKSHIIYLVLAFAMIIFAGEEISWGQRLLGFNTPDFFKQANRQGEANFHNLNFWEALDTSGNKKHGITRLFSSVAIYSYFWFSIFLAIPILNKYWSVAAIFVKKWGIPVFCFIYGLLFLTNFLAFEIMERTGIEMRPVGEVKETNYALLFLTAFVSFLLKPGQIKDLRLNKE